ncbi:hypothetical protein M0811_06485 [Anaeramoeba ignava]|uniref:PAS domain-containing protein n=1 Tax=Anaeramoeba ignava TaxID=1746090 RepID=A0A9Q0LME9_ANAIG|nr:hypothetical protein M0811_06485 [Anaeramoeba ignava]
MGVSNSAKKKISKREIKEYKMRVEKCSESILLVDNKANFIEANKAAVKMFKAKSKKDVLEKGPNGLAGPYQPAFKMPTMQASALVLKNAFESPDGFYDFDFLHVDCENKEFWCHVWVTPINWGGELVLQGYARPVSEPGITKTFDLSEEAAFFIKPVAEKMLQAKSTSNSKTETDSQTDSFIGDDFKTTTELSDTENPVNFSEVTSQTDQERKPKTSSKKQKETINSSFPNVILFDNDEDEIQLENRIDKIKSVVRSHDNPVLEKTVVQELNEIKKIFSNSTQNLEKKISRLVDKLQKERNQHQQKYSQLESHLQKNLSKSQEAQNEYEVLFSKMKSIQEIFDDKVNQILNPKIEKQN